MVLDKESVELYSRQKEKLESRLDELFELRDELYAKQRELYKINKLLGINESNYVEMED